MSLAERASAAGDRVGELCGRVQAGVLRLASSRRARRRSCPRSSSRRCRYSRRPATTWPCTSPTPHLRKWRSMRAHMEAAAGRIRAGPRPRSNWRAMYRLSPLLLAPMVASSARPPCRNCSRGSTRTSHVQRIPLPPCLQGRGAGDARSLRRGARDPRRRACGAGGARRRSPAREHHRPLSPSGSSSWPAIPPPRASSATAGSACSRSWGARAFCRGGRYPGGGALRARTARRGRRLGRPRG